MQLEGRWNTRLSQLTGWTQAGAKVRSRGRSAEGYGQAFRGPQRRQMAELSVDGVEQFGGGRVAIRRLLQARDVGTQGELLSRAR
jgi:hypothetical protein